MMKPETKRLDQSIGSLLESWINRDTDDCRFCNEPVEGDPPTSEQFCDDGCEENWELVSEARIAIGSRDLEQRGYD